MTTFRQVVDRRRLTNVSERRHLPGTAPLDLTAARGGLSSSLQLLGQGRDEGAGGGVDGVEVDGGRAADFYGNGESEQLVARAIAGRREQVLLSVKSGMLRGPNGQMLGIDARPAAVKNFTTYSLKRLGVDVIDIYRPARLDPSGERAFRQCPLLRTDCFRWPRKLEDELVSASAEGSGHLERNVKRNRA